MVPARTPTHMLSDSRTSWYLASPHTAGAIGNTPHAYVDDASVRPALTTTPASAASGSQALGPASAAGAADEAVAVETAGVRAVQALEKVPTAGFAEDIVQQVQEPLFSSADVHNNYIDDLAWVGDLLLSKSVDDEIVLWRPVADVPRAARLGIPVAPASTITVLHRFKILRTSLWYMHMGLDASLHTLACGNTTGKVYVWRLRWAAVEAAAAGARPRITMPADVIDCGVGEVPVRSVEVVGPGALLVGMDDGRVLLLLQRPAAGDAA